MAQSVRQPQAGVTTAVRASTTLPLLLLTGVVALAPARAPAQTTNNALLAPHAQDLVVLHEDQLVPLKAPAFFQAPYTVLYYGAGWCPDCRRFSPTLVAAYNAQPKSQKQFEVLLLTMDKSEEGLRTFMRTEKMPWPALTFAKIAGAADLKKFYSGHGIPCLTLIDLQGKILIQSQSDQDAAEVLKKIEGIIDPASRPTASSR